MASELTAASAAPAAGGIGPPMSPVVLNVAYGLAFMAALFLIAAASSWWRVVRQGDLEGSTDRPALNVRTIRRAASATAVALSLTAAALLVFLLA